MARKRAALSLDDLDDAIAQDDAERARRAAAAARPVDAAAFQAGLAQLPEVFAARSSLVALLKAEHAGLAGNVWTQRAPNGFAQSMLVEAREEILRVMRKAVDSDALTLEVVVDETLAEQARAQAPPGYRELMEAMEAKNPALRLLRERFGGEPAY